MSAAALSAAVSSLLVEADDRDISVSAYPRLTAIRPKPCLFCSRSINWVGCVTEQEGAECGRRSRGVGVGH